MERRKKKSVAKRVIKIAAAVAAAVLLVAGGYVAYVFIDYDRIADDQPLEIVICGADGEQAGDETGQVTEQTGGSAADNSVAEQTGDSTADSPVTEQTGGSAVDNQDAGSAAAASSAAAFSVPVNAPLSVLTYNIGFGAYLQDYSFFMDGGKYSRAYSKAAVEQDMQDINDVLRQADSDFCILQEVDKDSTRSYHVDEVSAIRDEPAFAGFGSTFAVNYDSAYLFYPVTSPHGKSLSGLLTLSRYPIESALRRSLPIQTDFAKILDLDRCYSVNRIPADDGHELCLYNFHMSAYTTDRTIVDQQLDKMFADMQADRSAGNYVIAGGDTNKDLLGDSGAIFGVPGDDYSWAQPFPEEKIPDGFALVAPFDRDDPVPTCRNCDIGYIPGKTFVITVDGFLVSDNVEVTSSQVMDLEFMYSDHQPVEMEFRLVPAAD